MKKQKILTMFSGGLDSRVAAKLMEKKGFDVILIYFKLPFLKDTEKEIKEFAKKHKFKLKVFNAAKGKLLKEYLEVIKHPKHGRGTGLNPCIDCRSFMFKKAKKFADKNKIKFIASGEVLGQRPMSQHKKGLKTVEHEAKLKGRLIRPLIEKGIQGRKREKQIKMAKKFRINYPNPAGGCLLCEKALKKRFEFLLKRGIKDKELKFLRIGRHFLIDNCWIVLGRDEKENKILEKSKIGKIIISKTPGPSALILDKYGKGILAKVKRLIKAYSRGGNKKKFEKYRL